MVHEREDFVTKRHSVGSAAFSLSGKPFPRGRDGIE